jgi:hypothetical protein
MMFATKTIIDMKEDKQYQTLMGLLYKEVRDTQSETQGTFNDTLDAVLKALRNDLYDNRN